MESAAVIEIWILIGQTDSVLYFPIFVCRDRARGTDHFRVQNSSDFLGIKIRGPWIKLETRKKTSLYSRLLLVD